MRQGAIALLALCLALGLCACGGGGDTASQEAAQPKPPPLTRALRQSFPKPEADPAVSGSQEAIEAGEAACKGKTPKQVLHQYAAKAKLTAAQREALKQLPKAEAHPSADFVAGQLAALAYEGTLTGEAAEYGYRGCAYALARGVVGGLEEGSATSP
jgi:hypothetical protein